MVIITVKFTLQIDNFPNTYKACSPERMVPLPMVFLVQFNLIFTVNMANKYPENDNHTILRSGIYAGHTHYLILLPLSGQFSTLHVHTVIHVLP